MSSEVDDDAVFRALADARRRRMLDLMKDAPRTTGELCLAFAGELDRCTVMQHLGVLERAGLIVVRRVGRARWNHLDAAPLQDIYDRWISGYAQHAVELMARLKQEVEAA